MNTTTATPTESHIGTAVSDISTEQSTSQTPKTETALTASVMSVELKAAAITISTQEDYEFAAQFGQEVKQTLARVQEYFEPMKKAAHMAHREICNRETEMLKPLKSAESTIKATMSGYVEKVEAERKAAELEAQRIAQEETERKLAEAAALEEQGDTEGAANALLDAQMADAASQNVFVPSAAPKASGVSTSKEWLITNVDDAKVPVTFNGMDLRPVDKKAVMRLIKASKGSIAIPGITYKEQQKIALRK